MSTTSTQEKQRGLDLTFATSFMTTLIVAVAPTFVAFGFLVWARPDPHPFMAILASVLLTGAAFAAGSKIWENQPESFGYSFADLMLWHWVRREWAEEKLVRNARVLGYDRQGRFIGKNDISPERQLAAARAIGAALDAKSSYTIEHSKRVEKHAREMAAAMGLSEEETQELATAAALHDIGNLRVPEHVIRKAGELTLEERSTIEGHVLLGAIMAFEAGGETVVRGVRHHHERWDGNGYPSGLKGDKIPVFARVIGIAEAYDAMTSTRPYRQSFTQDQAVSVLREESDSQFDAALVETFVKTLPEPLEIVERFPFLAWAQRQLHELRILFRRVGAVAMSAAASTIAIALILGTAVIRPDVFDGGSNGADTERLPRTLADGGTQDRVLGERIALALADGNGTVTEYHAVLSEREHGRAIESSLRGDVIGHEVDDTDSTGSDSDGDGHGDTDGPDQGDGDGNGRGHGNDDRPDVVVNDNRGDGGGGGGGNNTPTQPNPIISPTPPGSGSNNPTNPETPSGPEDTGKGKGKGKGLEHAPGQNKDKGKPDKGNGSGNSDNAPGQNKDKGKPASSGNSEDKGKPESPGNSEDKGNKDGWAESESHGNSDNAPGHADDPSDSGPGNSDSAPGHSDDPGSSDSTPSNSDGDNGGGNDSPGSSDSAPGNSDGDNGGGNDSPGSSDSAPGNSDGNNGGGNDSPGSSDSAPGNSENSNAGGNGNGNGKDKDEESPEA